RRHFTKQLSTSKINKNKPTDYPAGLYQLANKNISKQLTHFLHGNEDLPDEEFVNELHQIRIKAKQLRYTMGAFQEIFDEPFKSIFSCVKEAQELLGIIHDCDVWTEFLNQFLIKEKSRTIKYYGSVSPFNLLKPGIDYFMQINIESRKQQYQFLVQKWQFWKNEKVWQNLREITTSKE
ncbi:MAG: CHAD domain-containing protein, partial [Anaerolineaceae bacterium]|nr:CHAD domain-containing protein [Anaerolineaceae bacterium]